MNNMAEAMIPITMFIGMTLVISLFFYFRYRSRSELQNTIRTAIDKGQELTPDIIDRLGSPKAPKHKDLRLSLIWFAIAIGFSFLGFGIASADGDMEVFKIMGGVAGFPLMLGFAYLIMWRVAERDR